MLIVNAEVYFFLKFFFSKRFFEVIFAEFEKINYFMGK